MPYARQFFEEDQVHELLLRLVLCLLPSEDRLTIIDRVAPRPGARGNRWFRDKEAQGHFRESLLEEIDDSDGLANELRGRTSRIGDLKTYRQVLRKSLEEQFDRLPVKPAAHPVEALLSRFCKTMKLDDGERAVLMAAYLENEVPAFHHALGDFEGTRRMDFIAKGTEIPRALVMRAFSSHSLLRACEFIDRRPLSGNLCLSDDIRMYLETGDEASLVSSSCVEPVGVHRRGLRPPELHRGVHGAPDGEGPLPHPFFRGAGGR
jgi:DNA-binding phage protein